MVHPGPERTGSGMIELLLCCQYWRRRQDPPSEDGAAVSWLTRINSCNKAHYVLMNAEAPQEVFMSWKLPSASTMPLSAAWLCVLSTLLPKLLRWLKAKDERRERRDDFANETADDAEAGDSEEYLMTKPSGAVRHRVCRAPFERSVHQEFRIASSLCLEHRSVYMKPAFTGRRGAKCPLAVSDTKIRPLPQYNGRQPHNRSGFISPQGKERFEQMVLHAEQIELIDSETSHMARYFRRRKFCRFTARKAFKRSTIKISLR